MRRWRRLCGVSILVTLVLRPHALSADLISTTLLNAASVDETAVAVSTTGPIGVRGPTACTVYIEWGTGTSAGVVTIEEAATTTYSGTWASVQVVSWAAATVTDAVHLAGAIGAVRTRISTAMVGGTVTTRVTCS